jgi:ribosomal-protein-alanine acetyltransferase
MEIRPAHPADLPRLIALAAEAPSAAHWSRQLWLDILNSHSGDSHSEASHQQSSLRRVWIAEDPAAPIGFLVALCGPEWELENIVVATAFRRRGVGRALLSTLLDQARARRAERILLEVRVSNREAQDFYLQSGFQQLARRRDYYRDPQEDALILVHFLC